MSNQSLEDLLQIVGNPASLLRNSSIGAYVYPVVPSEYSNWRDEQRAWRETAVLFDQSHHMVNLYLEGPDALKLLTHLGTNSFVKFPVNRAKQFAPCSYDGYVIGDGILFHLNENKLVFVGRAPAANWIQFHAETGSYDGPNAPQIIEKLNGGPIPDIKVFQYGCYRHCGTESSRVAPWHGWRTWIGSLGGPYEERDEIRDAIIRAGSDFGLREVGSRAYATNTLESGWIPSPLPAVYTGEKMKAYRSWLPSTAYEGDWLSWWQFSIPTTLKTITCRHMN